MKQNDPPTLITIPSTTATPTVFRKDTSPSSSSSPSSKGRSFFGQDSLQVLGFSCDSPAGFLVHVHRIRYPQVVRRQRQAWVQQHHLLPEVLLDPEKESRVVLSVKMVSQHQSKDSGSKKNEGKELGMVAPQDKSSKKMKFASSSAETEPTSQTTISDDSKTGRGMSTMPRVVKRKLQKLRPIVEYNKKGERYWPST
ncbi:hypothetical protein L3X38_033532 [Prunus dulcis]|uniref:Uncharacterized protein n=1 Tax=Prunus dulcis TaxID=3755 RepID=A0AAD4YX17_PRUDU|nr:hypothetical protein L3X38_033532 [Prunus dulcis]